MKLTLENIIIIKFNFLVLITVQSYWDNVLIFTNNSFSVKFMMSTSYVQMVQVKSVCGVQI